MKGCRVWRGLVFRGGKDLESGDVGASKLRTEGITRVSEFIAYRVEDENARRVRRVIVLVLVW